MREEVNDLEIPEVIHELAINRALYVFKKPSNRYIVRSLSWRSLTFTENFMGKWLKWSLATEYLFVGRTCSTAKDQLSSAI